MRPLLTLLALTFLWYNGAAQISTFPYSQDFESFSTCGGSCSASCSLSESWINSTADDGDWIVDVSGTSSINTGPSTDHTSGTSTGRYLYTEASGCAGDVKDLISPEFNLTGLAGSTCPAFLFWYHMFGATMGTMEVFVSTDGGSTYASTPVFSRSGDQGNSWSQAVVDLTPYTSFSSVRFLFRGTIGSSFTSDMAIDDVQVLDVNGIPFSSDFSGLPATMSITDAVVNLTPLAIGGTFSGPGVSGNFFSPIAAGTGTHTITHSVLPGSPCTSSTSKTVVVNTLNCAATFPVPYAEDFESFPNNSSACGATNPLPVASGWINSSADGMDWTVDAAGTSSVNTGPSIDHKPGTSSGKYLYTETSGAACNNVTAVLISPCLDLSGVLNPSLTFWYHQFGANQGNLDLEISIDQGNNWTNIFSSSPGDLGDQWNMVLVNLAPYAGSTAVFRFLGNTGSSFQSDLAIDDFSIEAGAAPIPAMSEWALFLFGLIVLTAAVVVSYNFKRKALLD